MVRKAVDAEEELVVSSLTELDEIQGKAAAALDYEVLYPGQDNA